jgi:Gpi18-like mannosyltransferase
MSADLTSPTPEPETPTVVSAIPESTPADYTTKLVYWLVAAFIFRLFLIRFPYMFTLDVNTFRAWGDTIVKVGPTHFYDKTWSDYPPLFMYFLWIWGLIQQPFTHSSVMTVQWAKLPGCIADIANAAMIFYLLKGRVAIRSAYRTAVFYAFNPVTLFVSAIWGQVDAVVTFFMLLVMAAVLGNKLVRSAALGAATVLVKPQGLFMLPVVFFSLWWRNHVKRWPLAIGAGLVTAWLILLPATWHKLAGSVPTGWGFNLPALVIEPFFWFSKQMSSTGNNYPYSTVNAFNIWMLPPPNEAWKPDSRLLFGIQHYTWGLALTAACLLLVGWYLWKNRALAGPFQYFLAASVTLTGFYMLATRMHERYIFPAIAFLALAQACNRRLRWLYWGFTITSFLSISYIFFFYNDQSAWVEGLKNMMNEGRMLGSLKLSGMVVLSLLNVWLFGELLSFLFVKGEMVPDQAENRLVQHFRTLKAQVVTMAVDKLDYLIPAVIAGVFLIVALYRLGFPNEQIFDEVYHARTAMEYIKGVSPYEWTHPPMAKLLAALGILGLHGQFDLAAKAWTEQQAFAWRFVSVLFGSATLPVVYALARSMFENRKIATIATILLALDGVFFVQSRVAMTNIYEVFFIMVSALGMWLYIKYDRPVWLIPMSIGLGCALATRWSSLYAWGLTGLLFIYHAYRTKRVQWLANPSPTVWEVHKDILRAPKLAMLKYVGLVAVTMGVVPVVIYALSYIPYVMQGDGDWQIKLFHWHWDRGWGRVVTWQKDMWNYHAQLNATHPYSSPWWSWPIMLRPTWYYFHDWKDLPPKGIGGVWAIGNAFIWWVTVPALLYAAYLGWRDKLKSLGMLVLMGFGLWAMWGVQPRPLLYMHYMFETIPFLCIILAYLFYQLWYGEAEAPAAVEGGEGEVAVVKPALSQKQQRAIVVVHVALIVGWFIFYYPLLAAWPIPWSYYNLHIWFSRAWI